MEPSLETDLRGLLPSSLIQLWRRRGLESLLPLQRRALKETGLFQGRNLLVLAPSSSGKTLIAELAVARALASGRRAIYLTPTRALAEQQFAAFESGLEGTGLRAVCSTSDRPESDAVVSAGRFDVLVAVYEKVRGFLAMDTRLLAGTGAIAIDEIQTLGDSDRGPWLDLLITQILRCAYAPQVVAIGSPLRDAAPLSRWLQADVLESADRPVDLREGVLVTSSGRFHYRSSRDGGSPAAFGRAPHEPWGAPADLEKLGRGILEAAGKRSLPCDEGVASLLAAAADAVRARGPVMLFAPTRRCSRRWATLLAGIETGWPSARVALGALERSATTGRVRKSLREALVGGVAFHNAELSPELRTLVESAFESGEVRLLVSTPTLAIGMNLRARSVFHAPWRLGSPLEAFSTALIRSQPSFGAAPSATPVAFPLDRDRFAQQGGRAGRLGRGREHGYSVLVAQSEVEARRLWESLVAAPPPDLSFPPLACLSPETTALGMFAGGLRRTAGNLIEEFNSTFSGNLEPHQPERAQTSALSIGLGSLDRRGLVRQGEDGLWGLTGLGETAVRASLEPATVELLSRVLDEDLSDVCRFDSSEFSFLFRLALTVEGGAALAGLPFARRRPPLPLPEGMEDAGEEAGLPAVLASRRGGLTAHEVRAWCAASALYDWSRGMPTEAFEEKYDVEAGSVGGAAEAFARLVNAAASLARLFEPDEESCGLLAEFAERLIHGVEAGGLPLARLRVPGLSRDALMTLAAGGYGDPSGLIRVPEETLTGIVGPDLARALQSACRWTGRGRPDDDDAARAARAQAARRRTHHKIRKSGNDSGDTVSSTNPLLEIDLQSPGIVRAAGCEVRLPPLGFDLLVALAERPGEVVTRDALYYRLWPEGGPEDQQLDAHRRRLIARFRTALRGDASSVAEVVRGIGFRLAFDPTRVRLNRDSVAPSKTGCALRPSPG